MKKYLYRIIGLGFAILATLACSQKEEVLQEKPKEETFQLNILAGDPTTRTIIDESGDKYNILWQVGDQLGVYEAFSYPGSSSHDIFPTKTTSSALTAGDLSNGGKSAVFPISLHNNPYAATYGFDYTFVYPAASLSNSGDSYYVTLPAAQTFDVNSFDRNADVLVSEHQQFYGTHPSSVNARFARLGGTARMVIKAPTTTETVRKIVFSTTESVSLAGSYELNPATGELSDGITTNGTNSITLTPAVSTTFSGDVVVWFRLAEITLTDNFTVSVTTDKKTYTKTMYLSKLSRTLEFRNSKLVRFGIDMTDASGVTGLDNIRTDVINSAFTGVPSYTYEDWSNKKGSATNAVYAGNTDTRSNGDIGIKAQDNCGIITTASAGKAKSVSINAKAYTSGYTNKIDIYGKNTAYSSTSELYNDSQKGTLIGTLSFSSYSTQTLDITSDYAYIGIRSQGYALDIKEILISWEGAPIPETTTGNATSINSAGATLNGSFANAAGGIYEAGFYWDTTSEALAAKTHPTQFVTTDGTNAASGSFSCALGSLNEMTTYYYRAYILWLNTETNTYQEFLGEIKSFQTTTRDYSAAGWLEMPAYTVSGMAGTTTSSLSDLYCVTHKATMGGTEQRNYTILYDPDMYTSYWVAYPICSNHLTTGRVDSWGIYDPKVPASKQVDLSGGYGVDIYEGGVKTNYYARGHQIPNADRNNVPEMQQQTYYPTNITPQLQEGFNGGIWMDLESAVRSAVHTGDTVYVVTGAAFRKKGGSEVIKTIDARDKTLPIPNYYWKVLLKVKWNGDSINGACAVGFWLEHRDDLRTNTSAYQNYATTVDQIEEWTGFDFFANLPTELQALCENKSDWTTFKNF